MLHGTSLCGPCVAAVAWIARVFPLVPWLPPPHRSPSFVASLVHLRPRTPCARLSPPLRRHVPSSPSCSFPFSLCFSSLSLSLFSSPWGPSFILLLTACSRGRELVAYLVCPRAFVGFSVRALSPPPPCRCRPAPRPFYVLIPVACSSEPSCPSSPSPAPPPPLTVAAVALCLGWIPWGAFCWSRRGVFYAVYQAHVGAVGLRTRLAFARPYAPAPALTRRFLSPPLAPRRPFRPPRMGFCPNRCTLRSCVFCVARTALAPLASSLRPGGGLVHARSLLLLLLLL